MSAQIDHLAAIARELEPDAVDILVTQAERLAAGRAQYGDLDIDTDKRDWLEQAIEEALDDNSSLTIKLVKLRLLRLPP